MKKGVLYLANLEKCPTHQSPLKMGKVEDFTVVWCGDCVEHIKREPNREEPIPLWAAYYIRPIIEVRHEEQS